MKEVKIYILLQELKSSFGSIYKFLKGGSYNHASIGLGESFNEFYSFRTKWGLCIEHPFNFDKEYKKEVLCVLYEISVSQEQYEALVQEIHSFIKDRENYHYSYLSLFLGFLGIKHEFTRGYYCSRFVANLLDHSGAMKLHKHSSLYLPSDFLKDPSKLHFEGLAKEFSPSESIWGIA